MMAFDIKIFTIDVYDQICLKTGKNMIKYIKKRISRFSPDGNFIAAMRQLLTEFGQMVMRA